jgi:hypothetical protein
MKFRKTVTALVFFGIRAVSVLQGAETSQWVYPGPDGKLVYKTTSRGDRILDFSTAGYMGGGVALPAAPVAKVMRPTGLADETATIQAAINEVAALPLKNGSRGAVLLAAGTFICSKPILIPANGIVLRGSGTKNTTIMIAPQSLYLAQLAERLGPMALKNIGYGTNDGK